MGMKHRFDTLLLIIPSGVELTVNSRHFRVKGPRGEIQRNLNHLLVDAQVFRSASKNVLKIDAHLASKKHLAAVKSLRSHVANMITGVTRGFMYRMRQIYKHHPMNLVVKESGKQLEIENFLGERKVRKIKMMHGVHCEQVNDLEIRLLGNDIEDVSRSAASISQSCLPKRHLDNRKFLDGIYVLDCIKTITPEEKC